LSPVDHLNAGKFRLAGNRSPKTSFKAHAFLYHEVDQIMGRGELSIRRADT
jgi:hypothetical protein